MVKYDSTTYVVILNLTGWHNSLNRAAGQSAPPCLLPRYAVVLEE